jgi:serine/threonine-protein kinase
MAKIELLTDASAFVDLLDKSGLLPPEAIADLRKSAAGQPDASALARQLIKADKLTAWQARQLLGRYTRLTIGKYRLLSELGKGPMGRVYLAEHDKLNKRVSLKVLPARFGSQPEVLKRFLDEANRAGALNHRNIIHIFDVGKDDEGRYYLAMEYVEGKDLQRLVEASGPLPSSRAIDLVRQAADGLAHAHEQGLTHGDLKPTNLIVDASGVLKILDLGLSELADHSAASTGSEESTEAPSLAGLACRAPELLAGKRHSDVRSDLYSIGAILYFLLTGKPPAIGESDAAAALLQVTGVVPELANLCDHLLASDPQERPESAAHVVAALDLAARALPSAQKPADKPPPERPPSAGASKRPLVAKPSKGAAAIEVGEIAPASEPTSDDSLAGFSIKTGRKRKTAAPKAPAVAADAAQSPAAPPRPARTARAWPIIPIALIAGGVLVIAAMVTVIIVLLNRGGSQSVAKATKADAAPAAKAQEPVATKGKESISASNPETNPTADSEDAKGAAPASAPGAQATGEKAAPTKTSDPPAETKTGETTPAPAPMPATTVPAPPPVSATDTKTKTPPTETKTEPTTPPAPSPSPTPTPPANPFAGFAAAVGLPPLEVTGKPAPEALAPAALGPVKIEPNALCIIHLKGGDTAFKSKTKFLLEPANQGTAPRDWEFKFQNDKDSPTVIATLSLKEDKLVFQWAEEATRQQAAPYLGNCVLALSAGAGTHQVALRKPLVVEPLALQLEKGAFSESWNLESPPPGKQITVEFNLQGGAAKHKVDPKTELEAFKDTTYLMAGNADDALILGFKLDVSMPAKSLRIAALPHCQLTGMPKPDRYLKATPGKLTEAAAGQIRLAQIETAATQANKNLNAEQKKQRETQANQALEAGQKLMAQIEQLKELAKSLQEGGKLHFRVHFLADDVQVDLINTGAAPPPPMPPAAKK